MSVSYEFTHVCDGKEFLEQAGVKAGFCQETYSEDIYSRPEDERKAWLGARNAGWRLISWRGKERHLCPDCATRFMERKGKG